MDGKNSSGRRISLLNDSVEPALHSFPPPSSSTPTFRSRASSYTSSPVGSPPIPQLMRSNSSDSSDSMQTPSPITPEFNFEGMASPAFSQSSFFPPCQKELHSAYPSISQTGPLPYHTPGASDAAYFPAHHAAEPRPSSAAPSSSTNPRSKKNSYPCPMAKQFNCNDYFTTSGHAARHAKKHTGKKDAFCPECNKAFTRKDNMEQHRRTHQSGRNAAKGMDSIAKKIKTQAKRPKPAPLQASMPPLAMLDPSLSASPSSSPFTLAPAVQPVDSFLNVDFSQRSAYPDPTAFSMNHNYSVGSSYGLDALAIAASGEKRKYES